MLITVQAQHTTVDKAIELPFPNSAIAQFLGQLYVPVPSPVPSISYAHASAYMRMVDLYVCETLLPWAKKAFEEAQKIWPLDWLIAAA